MLKTIYFSHVKNDCEDKKKKMLKIPNEKYIKNCMKMYQKELNIKK